MARIVILFLSTLFLATGLVASASAADPLAGLVIDPEAKVDCDRDKDYGQWKDADGDGEDTRQEVLIVESLVPVTRDEKGRVAEGLWVGPYAGFVTRDSRQLDIDCVFRCIPITDSGLIRSLIPAQTDH